MARIVEKGWGREVIFADEEEYCGKLLEFNQFDATFSMHFHMRKKETWHVLSGAFELTIIDTGDASRTSQILHPGDSVLIIPGMPHQLRCVSATAQMIEVSTRDSVKDNYRVEKGDSQS